MATQHKTRLYHQIDIAREFNSVGVSIEDICKKLNSENKLNTFVGAFGNADSEGKVMFGVNVRLNSNSTGVLPFIYTNIKGFDAQKVAQRVHEDYNIPSLYTKYNIKEALIKFDVDKRGRIKSYEEIETIAIPSESSDKGEKTVFNGKSFLDDFVNVKISQNGNEYLSAVLSNLKEFKLKGSFFYMWIVAEDFDIEKMIGTGQHYFLSNILAFTTTRYDMEKIRSNRAEILRFLFLLKARYSLEMEIQRRRAAINSAKAAIMSRNMSHNLGSHVMYYIKQKLQNVQKIIDGGVLKNLKVDGASDINSIKQLIVENGKDLEMPFLVGLGRFINYLQERQDYIATVATDYIPSNSTISFKDFIYDELKPDLRYERHKKIGSSSSETRRQQPKNLLMDYIAFSEGYDTSEKIRIRFGAFDGTNPPLMSADGNVSASVYDKTTPQYKSFRKLRDFNVALPGGVIGRQALFSIMENIIRNAAKHSERRSDNLLSIDFDILDPDDLSIYEGLRHLDISSRHELSKEELIARYQSCKDRYTILSITNNMPNTEASVEKLVCGLAIPYIKTDATMEDSGKGLKEIRISASWMRRYQHDMDIPATEPPAVSVRALPYVDEKTGETVEGKMQIQYLICIPKPMYVAFVVPDGKYEAEKYNKELIQLGCALIPESEAFQRHLYDYDMVVFCCDDENNTRKLLPTLSSRYILYKEENVVLLSQMLDCLDTDMTVLRKHLNSFYELWRKGVSGDSDVKLSILDDKTLNARKGDVFLEDANAKEKLIISTTSAGAEEYSNNVVYSTHHVSMCHIPEENLSGQENAAFIEGITGNNSTDRLIRQTIWDKEWMNKHIVAGLSKIVIFDERIFSKVNPPLVNVEPSFVREYLKELMGDSQSVKFKYSDFIKACRAKSQGCNLESFRTIFFKDAESDGYKKSINITMGDVEKICQWFVENERDTEVSRKYHENNIWAFDIRCCKDRRAIEVLGYDVQLADTIGKYDSSRHIDVIMTIEGYKDKDGELDFDVKFNNDTMRNRFNLMTIHQGILDKIYDTFEVKDKPKFKERVTKCLYEKLIKSPTVIELDEAKYDSVEYTPYFLPRLVVHSGRSKPGFNDMPQKLPFVQFAAIDHAVSDCKYTLSELLYSAHYENSNSNKVV